MIRAVFIAFILMLYFAGLGLLVARYAGAAEPCRGQLVTVSWYGAESGTRTASGLRFDGSQWLVAHKTLPFGTLVKLSYNDRSVTVPVEDRGPYIPGRTFDLSRRVAQALGTFGAGVAQVCWERAS